MRAYILSTCALMVAACGGADADSAGSPDSASVPAAGVQLAQNDAAPAAPAADAGPDLSGLPAEYQSANLANGRTQWFLCAACHQINNGSSHSVGPDLFHIFGNTAGANATFPIYSPALKESGIVWTPETMDPWLTNPRNVATGTTMIFPGMANADQRRDLIAYLWVETGGLAE